MDVFWAVSAFKNTRADGSCLCDDGRLERRTVKLDASNEGALGWLHSDANVDVPVLFALWEEREDRRPVSKRLSPHLILVVEEGRMNAVRNSGERRRVERSHFVSLKADSGFFVWENRDIREVSAFQEVPEMLSCGVDVVLVDEVFLNRVQGNRASARNLIGDEGFYVV